MSQNHTQFVHSWHLLQLERDVMHLPLGSLDIYLVSFFFSLDKWKCDFKAITHKWAHVPTVTHVHAFRPLFGTNTKTHVAVGVCAALCNQYKTNQDTVKVVPHFVTNTKTHVHWVVLPEGWGLSLHHWSALSSEVWSRSGCLDQAQFSVSLCLFFLSLTGDLLQDFVSGPGPGD